jgi:hypothetical protein
VSDNTRYIFEIYHNGVVFRAKVRGKKRYVMEKDFLARLTGQRVPTVAIVPDASTDFFDLDDEQLAAYSEFRKELAKAERA